jgi:hypothetical protein
MISSDNAALIKNGLEIVQLPSERQHIPEEEPPSLDGLWLQELIVGDRSPDEGISLSNDIWINPTPTNTRNVDISGLAVPLPESSRKHSAKARDKKQGTDPLRLPQHKLNMPPKSELYTLYGTNPYHKVLRAADYITWTDNGPPHNMRFTSVFVCPVTGETFRSGGWGQSYEWKDGFCWFTSKKLAEHGAAARAYDCLSFRAAKYGQPYQYVGDDEPYRREARRPMSPTGIPPRSWNLIVDAQSRAPHFDSDEEMDIDLFGSKN